MLSPEQEQLLRRLEKSDACVIKDATILVSQMLDLRKSIDLNLINKETLLETLDVIVTNVLEVIESGDNEYYEMEENINDKEKERDKLQDQIDDIKRIVEVW